MSIAFLRVCRALHGVDFLHVEDDDDGLGHDGAEYPVAGGPPTPCAIWLNQFAFTRFCAIEELDTLACSAIKYVGEQDDDDELNDLGTTQSHARAAPVY